MSDAKGLFGILDDAVDAKATVEVKPSERDPIETDPVAWCEWASPKIEHKKHGQVIFRPYDYQKRIMRLRAAGKSFVCEKSRQTGVSTATIMADVHAVLYSDACFGHIIAQKEDVAKDRLLEIAKRALRTCILTNDQKRKLEIRGHDITYDHKNYLRCHTAAPNSTRSWAGNRILLEEAAYMDYGEDVWKAIRPMIDDHEGQVAIVSTYNGDGDFFCNLVDNHEARGLELVSIDWRMHPERDEEWKRRSMAGFEGSEDEWREEHELHRLKRGEMVVDVALVTKLAQAFADVCIPVREHPVKGHEYVLGSDVGGGGRSRSVNVAIDITTSPAHLAVMEYAAKQSHPERKAFVEAFRDRFPEGSEHWMDGGGPGATIVEEMEKKPEVIILVGGSATYGRKLDEVTNIVFNRVPRDRLLTQGARKLESGTVVVPQWHKRAYMAMRSARWAAKRTQQYNDELDAMLIGVWPLPEDSIVSVRGTGPVEGLDASETLQRIIRKKW